MEDNGIKLIEEIMRKLRRAALERDASVSDVVHEALANSIFFQETDVNFFDVMNNIEKNMNETEHFITNVDLYNYTVIVKSPLRYVHRPELKYEIKITQNDHAVVGRMSASLRSQDINTAKCFSAFLNFWIDLETAYFPARPGGKQIEYITDIGYFSRKMYMPAGHKDSRVVGAAISDYIRIYDELFKYYYYHPNGGRGEIERMYRDYMKTGKLKI